MNDIVGTWRLVKTAAVDAEGRPLPAPYGPEAMGTVTFSATGRMMAVLCDGRRELQGVREYNSYCGNYKFDGKQLVTKVDAASTVARMGTDQVRDVRFDGARMVLRPPLQPYGEREQQRELTWERIG